jgi:hypothetical protein
LGLAGPSPGAATVRIFEQIEDGLLLEIARRPGLRDLSARVRNALLLAGYLSAEQISAATDDELLSIRTFGPAYLRETRAVLPHLGATKPCPHCGGSGVVRA